MRKYKNHWDNKDYLVNVFQDTRNQSLTKFIDETLRVQNNTRVYTYPEHFNDREYVQYKNSPPLHLVDADTLTAASMLGTTNKVGILNFASGTHPGGGVRYGARAQEEAICRCSNLYEALSTTYCHEHYYAPNTENGNRVFLNNIIYSPDVMVFKSFSYQNIKIPFKVNVITCPAPACAWENDDDAYECYVKRIECIIKVAIDNRIEDIILGAWGCGAYHQNPELVSRAFVEVLSKYGGAFKTIVFAIPDMYSVNYKAFKHTFNRTWLGKVEEIYCGN